MRPAAVGPGSWRQQFNGQRLGACARPEELLETTGTPHLIAISTGKSDNCRRSAAIADPISYPIILAKS